MRVLFYGISKSFYVLMDYLFIGVIELSAGLEPLSIRESVLLYESYSILLIGVILEKLV
jgi:hypothetical protein